VLVGVGVAPVVGRRRQRDRPRAILALAIDGMRIGLDASGVACRSFEHSPDRAIVSPRCRSSRDCRHADDLRLEGAHLHRVGVIDQARDFIAAASLSRHAMHAVSLGHWIHPPMWLGLRAGAEVAASPRLAFGISCIHGEVN
jgi:hypothetical protein